MGHAEMLLAVAGMSELELQQRAEVLSSGDWSSFAPRERVVMHYAKHLAQNPHKIRPSDVAPLVRHWGKERALDHIWHVSWCNFMTRVADAFQIQLESVNVFLPTDRGAK